MLYLLKSENYYKIGFSKDLESLNKRIKAYNMHNPEYEFLGSCKGDRSLEKLIHNTLKLKKTNILIRHNSK